MLDEQKQRATEAIQKAKRSSADREVSAQDDEDFDLGNHIDDTLLDITQAYELNINEIVTNALRRKSNTPIETLEQFTALDAEDFASLSHYRAEDKLDDLSDETNMLENELKQTKKTAGRRETRLSQCKTIIEKQQETLALQESNIAELRQRVDRGRERTRTPSRPDQSPAKSWSPPQRRDAALDRDRRRSRNPSTSPPVRLSEAPTHNTTTTTSSATHRRSIKVPEPPEFANDDKVKFAEWSTKMRMKLRAGEFDSQDETTKLHYLLSRTRNGPFMRLKMNDWYGDRHEKSRAYSNLANMSQGYNEPFADFYAKFEEKLAYVTMDDEQQMIQITEKLNGRYRSRIDDGTNYANPSASDRDRDRDRRPRGNRNASISSQGSTASSRSTSSTSTAASSVVATLPKLTDELR
ncbi:hypothetical protein D6C99_09708 [Aureobasidium pullulans]|uniref:Retrotransposon gag domain-containing protein n=1 Tax=Aureobasidium pullulans TaxID=5580 RepID=A0A4S9M4H5_AURPU|nr:hypothetical protein D6D15_10551 [Aureobasidium pullulans]THY37397.1 hypothetical protein D6C99_09708 [Aureobasidium pullulans]